MLSVKQTDAHWNSIVLSLGALQHLEAVRLNERGAQRVIYDCLHAGTDTAQTCSYSTDLGSRWEG